LLIRVWVEAAGEAGVEQLQVIVDFGQRADRGARGAHAVLLLDGDGGRDAVNAINRRLIHAVEELAHVWGESLHIATLPLSIERVKGERGLAGAGRAGDHRQLAQWDVEVEPLEVMLPRPTKGDGGGDF